uniref:uncharacterized protein LOC122582389 n=1 Tax=Erigeron canadensis TaxID=72917 RepID=UPI001CB95852|nr:uncharacterized protein LOC122582389 [Erigeron canadensis]
MVGTKEDLWVTAKSVEDLDWRKNKERGSNGHKSFIQTSMEMNGITFQDMQRVARGFYDEPADEDLPPVSNTDSDGKIINKSSLDHDEEEEEDLGQYDCSSESDIDIPALVKLLDDTSTDYSDDDDDDDDDDASSDDSAKPKEALKLKSFLQELHLEKYLTKFQKQKIGMSLVPIMTDCDLLVIGIKDKDDRKKIREALKAMPRDVSTSRRAF